MRIASDSNAQPADSSGPPAGSSGQLADSSAQSEASSGQPADGSGPPAQVRRHGSTERSSKASKEHKAEGALASPTIGRRRAASLAARAASVAARACSPSPAEECSHARVRGRRPLDPGGGGRVGLRESEHGPAGHVLRTRAGGERTESSERARGSMPRRSRRLRRGEAHAQGYTRARRLYSCSALSPVLGGLRPCPGTAPACVFGWLAAWLRERRTVPKSPMTRKARSSCEARS